MNRTALIIGITGGIGYETAKALRAQLRQLESPRSDEIESIIASEMQADSPAGRALHLLESS